MRFWGSKTSLRITVGVMTTVLTVVLSTQLWADEIRLRHITTDGQGNFMVFFSALYEGGNPIGDVGQIPLDGVRVEVGLTISDLQALEIQDVQLDTLHTDDVPFHVTVLLPNTALFNGVEGDIAWPDSAGHRSSLMSGLTLLPQRENVNIAVGVYSSDVDWLPSYTTEQLDELSAALLGPDHAAEPGTLDARTEDTFGAVDITYRTRLRPQARVDCQDVIHFFVLVTSAQTRTGGSAFEDSVDFVRQMFEGRDMVDVVPILLVYDPFSTDEQLEDPTGEHLRLAEGMTPNRGTYRLAGNPDSAERAFNQTLDEIGATFVLRFTNTDLELDEDYQFRVGVTLGDNDLVSNRLLVRLQASDVEDVPTTEGIDTPTTETPETPDEEIDTPPDEETDTPPDEETDTPPDEETDPPPIEDDVLPAHEEEADEPETQTEDENGETETEASETPPEDELPMGDTESETVDESDIPPVEGTDSVIE